MLLTLFGAPYVLGTDLVDLVDETGGDKAVNAAFDSPPESDAMLLDPFRFVAHDAATDVPVPSLADGETRVDDGDMGAIALIYLFLSTRLDAHEALEGVDGWAGDAFVGFERDGRAVHPGRRRDGRRRCGHSSRGPAHSVVGCSTSDLPEGESSGLDGDIRILRPGSETRTWSRSSTSRR